MAEAAFTSHQFWDFVAIALTALTGVALLIAIGVAVALS